MAESCKGACKFSVEQEKKVASPALHQESTLPIDKDPVMIEMFTHLDAINAFKKLYTAWLDENKRSWHSDEIVKQLDRINRYVNQLASYISLHHDDIDVQIQVDIDSLKGKQFNTVLKRQYEWKLLKQWLRKNEPDFRQQPLTVEALCKCIIIETKKLIDIV